MKNEALVVLTFLVLFYTVSFCFDIINRKVYLLKNIPVGVEMENKNKNDDVCVLLLDNFSFFRPYMLGDR